MSELGQAKELLTQLLGAIEAVEKVGDLDVATQNSQSRFEKAKQQEADLAAEREALVVKAKAEAQKVRELASVAILEQRREHDHYVRSVSERARAENDSILAQRDRLQSEIDALGKQAADLRNLVEDRKHELGEATDAAATARAMHETLKRQLAGIREALTHAS